MYVRAADPAERAAVANVLDGAALEVRDGLLERALATDAVLVAVTNDAEPDDTARILGALVLEGEEIVAVAVRPRRRGQGIGTALVQAALAGRGRVVARFDADVRPFWESLGFAIAPADVAGRFRGVCPTGTPD